MKSPYRAMVMSIITTILSFFGYHFVLHILEDAPLKDLNFYESLWLLPATLCAYSWFALAFACFVMIFSSHPLKMWTPLAVGIVLGLAFLILLTGIVVGGANILTSMIIGAMMIISTLFLWCFSSVNEFKEQRATSA